MLYYPSFKRYVQKKLEESGILLRRFHKARSEIHMILNAAERSGARLIFDVGANKGQFAIECFRAGFEGRIVSIEPQASAHRELVERSKLVSNWIVAPRMCIGDRSGEAIIHISRNSVSSSLLAVTERSITANGDTEFIGDERVPICTFDEFSSSYLQDDERFLLKIDTQGFEKQVVDGAKNSLARAGAIYAEMSLSKLYEGGASFNELYASLEQSGFRCIGIFQGFTNLSTLEMLQVNGLFIRNEVLS